MNHYLSVTKTYLEEMLGEPPILEPVTSGMLPLYLRERYQLFHVKLFGRMWVLALEAPDRALSTPSEYRKQVENLSKTIERPVVLVLKTVTSTVRNRMVRMNIPFIVPSTQIFLPASFIDLQEQYAIPAPTKGKLLSPTAQVILLHHLLCEPLTEASSKQIAKKLDYSPMAITKARNELESNQLCEPLRHGKEVWLTFPIAPKQLWSTAKPFLRSPVNKRYWVQWEHPSSQPKKAGISALSLKSMLADDKRPTYALRQKDFQRLLGQGDIRTCPDADDAQIRIECWCYDPTLLSRTETVDPLSLYLSLQTDHDERVQGELERMMKEQGWP